METLTERALLSYRQNQESLRCQEERQRCQAEESQREAFMHALSAALGLPVDRILTVALNVTRWPGAWTEAPADDGESGWLRLTWEQDGLTFRNDSSYRQEGVLLSIPCAVCGGDSEARAPGGRRVGDLLRLGELLTQGTIDASACEHCHAKAEAAASATPPPATPAPADPTLSVEERLIALLNAYVEDRISTALDDRDDAESTRESYRAEREARRDRAHAAAIHDLEERQQSAQYALEDELKKTRDELKRQQRGG